MTSQVTRPSTPVTVVPSVRKNAVTGDWVVISPARSARPSDHPRRGDTPTPGTAPTPGGTSLRPCPFCPGNEERDLEEISWPNQEHWTVRVVRNRFPALRRQCDIGGDIALPDGVEGEGETISIPGLGYHEVVITSRMHGTAAARESVGQLSDALRVARDRCRSIAGASNPKAAFVSLFENHGQLAGMSLRHPHWQIIATAESVPLPRHIENLRQRFAAAGNSREGGGGCPMCTTIAGEMSPPRSRIVFEGEKFVAWVIFAAEAPFHTWIAPKTHSQSFAECTDAEVSDLGSVLHKVLWSLYVGLCDPDYNLAVVNAPSSAQRGCWHWFLTVVPKTTFPAGWELATGMPINPHLPEMDAELMRSHLRDYGTPPTGTALTPPVFKPHPC